VFPEAAGGLHHVEEKKVAWMRQRVGDRLDAKHVLPQVPYLNESRRDVCREVRPHVETMGEG
jgi:hypothetical protein